VLLKGDPRNILGVIIDMNENDLYTIATPHSRLELTSCCRQQLLKDSDINNDKLVSLREDLKRTAAGGHGFVKM